MNTGEQNKRFQKPALKLSLEEMVYYFMFSILLFSKGIGLEEGSPLFRLCFFSAAALFLVKTALGKYTFLELGLIASGLAWGIYTFFHMGSLGLLVYAMLLFGMKNIPVSRVMKVGLAVWPGCMLLCTAAAIFFERKGVMLVHEKLGLGPVLRESLGYTHPNVLHISYILLMAFVLYQCRKEKVWRTTLLLMAGNLFVFLYSMSYTGILISAVLLLVYFYFTFRDKLFAVEKLLIQAVLPICIIISVVCPIMLDGDSLAFQILNKLLNSRIWAIKHFFHAYSITLFGEKILQKGYSLDNSFIYALAWYGIVFFAAVLLAYWFLVRRYVREDRRKELVIIIAFFIAGLTEQFLFNASIKNISIIFLGEALYCFTKNRGKELSLASKWNHSCLIHYGWMEKFRNRLKALPWKKTGITCIAVNIIVFALILLLPIKKYDSVYANEGHCDCRGEIVGIEEVKRAKNTLIIGDQSEGSRFYHFTQKNSNLIDVMYIRHKISVSIYVSASIILLGVLGRGILFVPKRNKE